MFAAERRRHDFYLFEGMCYEEMQQLARKYKVNVTRGMLGTYDPQCRSTTCMNRQRMQAQAGPNPTRNTPKSQHGNAPTQDDVAQSGALPGQVRLQESPKTQEGNAPTQDNAARSGALLG
jgi:hypothetical protein